MKKPKPLKKGDTIGIVSPSGCPRKQGVLEKAIKGLENLGYTVKTSESCHTNYGYLCGTDKQRADGINQMFADPQIDAIFCLRGGYGTPRIIDLLDYKLIKDNPKIFLGYSDITALHISINQHCNLVTFHGPMASSFGEKMDDFTFENEMKALTSTTPIRQLQNPEDIKMQTLNLGTAEGIICGGNLSLITATLGTPYEIDTVGKILFIEEIGEVVYRLDRMLAQLKQAGKFNDAAGIILGGFTDITDENPDYTFTVDQLFDDLVKPSGKPCIKNLMAGHCIPTLTLPLGIKVRMDADKCKIEYLENALED